MVPIFHLIQGQRFPMNYIKPLAFLQTIKLVQRKTYEILLKARNNKRIFTTKKKQL